jgi:hypothetical protein
MWRLIIGATVGFWLGIAVHRGTLGKDLKRLREIAERLKAEYVDVKATVQK